MEKVEGKVLFSAQHIFCTRLSFLLLSIYCQRWQLINFGFDLQREEVVKYQDFKKYMADTRNLQPVDIIPVVVGDTAVMKTNL